MLVDQIDKQKKIHNFKGAAVGNGCWGAGGGLCGTRGTSRHEIDFNTYKGHNMISPSLSDNITRECGGGAPGSFPALENESDACSAELGKMKAQAGEYYVYNLYDECGDDYMNEDEEDNEGTHRRLTISKIRSRLAQDKTVITGPRDSFAIHPQLLSRPGAGVDMGADTDADMDAHEQQSGNLRGVGDYPCGSDTVSWKWLFLPGVVCGLLCCSGSFLFFLF
jgi:hypothetical protein